MKAVSQSWDRGFCIALTQRVKWEIVQAWNLQANLFSNSLSPEAEKTLVIIIQIYTDSVN